MISSLSSNVKKPFDPSDLKVEVKNATIGLLCDMLSKDLIDLEPDFQRKADVWDKKKKSRLIESLILGLPLPSFYFYVDQKKGKWVIIDGLQRLCALKDFIVDKTLCLTNLELLSNDQYNRTYDQFSYFEQLTISMRSVTLNVLSGDSSVEAKYIIFRRINSEGTVSSPAEVRNALFHDKSMELVRELANSGEFKNATDYKVSEKRLLPQDYVARFLSFYVLGYRNYENSNMETFIGKGLEEIDFKGDKFNELRTVFYNSLNICKELLGDYCFRLPVDISGREYSDIKKKKISISLFEATMFAVSKLDARQKIVIINNKDAFRKAYIDLFKHDEELRRLLINGTNQPHSVNVRFSRMEKLINTYSEIND